ncbi:NADH dehydrogenase, FAD-containing subunit [Actinacidiphila yanglinensis]|uniref:NADH dehydrogenase, FAD-containing subunit n=1 Tax=Actinacidiphila yanglinensis TaxID=310779 RepID=A0A1H6DQC1_9ACTN|nr:FAD-dependent oxidoreductase [Actinacidiphila yanglinensis]SEG87410.1 NADH dehydrogenase, FAD-containing subunit [Actinacidiphila yanglinensis]
MGNTVAVVGGGYGGAALARLLDADFDVLLVDPKDAFVHTVAALRGLVDEEWSQRIYFGFDGLLRRGRHVRDRAVVVDERGVTTAGGTRLDADYVVLATGSSYPYPAKPETDDSAAARERHAETRSALAAAERVLILGAGPVGLELAGEITERWPERQVVLVDPADDVLAGRYLPELRSALREQLVSRGVEFVLGSALASEPPVPSGVHAPFTVHTLAGTRVQADLWFRCYGVSPLSGMLGGALAAARRPDGHVEVDAYLRVAGLPNVFAIGDVTAVPEPKRSKAAAEHASVVADNIAALAGGRPPARTYRPGGEGVLVPLGSTGGASQVPGPEGPLVLGPADTVRYKGGDLLVARYAELFGSAEPVAG